MLFFFCLFVLFPSNQQRLATVGDMWIEMDHCPEMWKEYFLKKTYNRAIQL